MPKLENINLEPEIVSNQELAEKEKAVLEKAQGIFRKNAALASELLSPEDLNLRPERISELNGDLGQINEETKRVLDELKTDRADSYDAKKAA